jgi:hypothetical protein
VRLVFQRSRAILPEKTEALSFFEQTPQVWSLPPEQLRDGLITLGAVLAPALVVVIENHVDTADPVVMDGDAILIAQRSMFCTCKKSMIGEVLPLLLCYTVPCTEDQLRAKAPWHENVIQVKVFVAYHNDEAAKKLADTIRAGV